MIGDPLALIGLVALLAATATGVAAWALREFSRTELQETCERNGRPERFREVLRLREPTALGVDLLGVLAGGVFAAATVAWGLAEAAEGVGPTMVVSCGVVAGLVLGVARVAAPWALSRLYAASLVYHFWPLWRAASVAATPLRAAARLLDAVLHRLAGRHADAPGDEDALEEEIRTIVTEGHREGLLEEDAREMIEGVIDLGDAKVSQIMTPRTDIHMLPLDLSWGELIADVVQLGHTRIPVHEGSRDEIVGVLYVKDLLPELAKADESERRGLREITRRPIFVPGSKPVDDLLEMFQQERTHIALVLDEYGGLSGLVTIEDVLEEIVGEIVDEYDADVEVEIRPLSEGVIEAMGRTHVDEVNEAVGAELPEDGAFDTIGGFVFSELGRVPAVGEQVEWDASVRVTVLEATGRRIERVRVERIEAPAAESA